jgi:DNA mismatch repair protein MutH
MEKKITLNEALSKLERCAGKRVRDFATPDKINKGSAGQILEQAIGLNLSTDLMDFSDGELKTNKFLRGKPAETLAITQVGHTLPDIVNDSKWENCLVKMKINSFIFLPVHKDSNDPGEWVYGVAKHFDARKFPREYDQVESDYLEIAQKIRDTILNKKELHTINGTNKFLQIRTKDSKDPTTHRYHPIRWEGEVLSDKNYAFYFRPQFLNAILAQNL